MKKKNKPLYNSIINLIVLVLFLLIFVSFSILALGEPDVEETKETNPVSSLEEKVAQPTLSHKSGFYKESFVLTMEAEEGTKIYYTTDSSTPTTSSAQYVDGITIEDASSNPNNYCNNPDFWPYQVEPEVEGEPEIMAGYYARYERIQNPIDKCTVIRAIAVDEEGNVSNVETASYFVGYDQKNGYSNTNILSLVSDPDGLFSDETGIMVNGSKYKEALQNGTLDGVDDIHVIRQYTNTYIGRGKEWEREVHLDYFSEGGEKLLLSQVAGIRLHGNQTRVATRVKSFSLYAREDYGNDVFQIPIFDNGILSDRLVLIHGDDVRNAFLSELMNNRTMYSQKYKLIQVFLDGEYWGMYAIQEKYSSKQYMKTYYDLDKGDYVLVAGKPTGYQLKRGEENTTTTSFASLKAYAANHDLSDEKEYSKICSMMDMQSFIDSYAARIYTGDQDWSWFKNQYLLYFDNKWHWLLYDMDYGAGSHVTAYYDVNTFLTTRLEPTQSLANDPLFPHFMKNASFRKDFVNTFMDLMNDTYRTSTIEKKVNGILEKYTTAYVKSQERYPSFSKFVEGTDTNYYVREYQQVEEYFQKRPDYAATYLKDYFGLQGSLVHVTVSSNDPAGGTIKVNTAVADLSENGSWIGRYYTDYSLPLTAEPKEGYKFAGWQCENGSLTDNTSASTDLSFQGDVRVTAIFEKE